MARSYMNRTGRFTSPDPGHVGANPENPQSWNAYTYGANDPINTVDPTGTEYVICADGGNCFSVDTWEEYINYAAQFRLYGYNLPTYPDLGGFIESSCINGRYCIRTYYIDPRTSGLIREMHRRADATENLFYTAAGASIVIGATGGLAVNYFGVTAGSGLTTLSSSSPYFSYTAAQLNALIGGAQRQLLTKFLLRAEQGAAQRLRDFRIPSGLTRRTLEIYKEIAQRVVSKGPGAHGYEVQLKRLELVNKALQMFR
jgi:hypothetical protein